MSIIYNALKKTQNFREQSKEEIENKNFTKKTFPRKSLYISIFFLILFFSFLIWLFPRLHSSSHVIHAKKTTHAIPTFSLNGVFVSDQAKIAMINHRFLKLGDSINHFKIIRIEFDRVVLRSEETTITLKS